MISQRRAAEKATDLHQLISPDVEPEGPDLGDVRAQVPVNSAALDAHEHAQVDGGPFWLYSDRETKKSQRRAQDSSNLLQEWH